MNTESKKWLDAAIVLGRDPTAKVRCPVCEGEYLTVRDVYPKPDSDNFERYLECPNCRSRNIMRMKRSSASALTSRAAPATVAQAGSEPDAPSAESSVAVENDSCDPKLSPS